MTEYQRASLQVYICDLAARLRLADWRIRLAEEPPEDKDVDAEVWQAFKKRSTFIRVRAGWMDLSPDSQRDAIVHELLHLHLAEMNAVLDKLGGLLGQPAWDIVSEQYLVAEEVAVDTLAGAIAPMLPLWEPPKESA